jgi:hypothetical protein
MTTKSDELAEARGHLMYFQQQLLACAFAMDRMGADLKLCERGIKRWSDRVKVMEASSEASNSPVAEGEPKKQPRHLKEGDLVKSGAWYDEEGF